MIEILKASSTHSRTISELGKQTFLESHGTSASPSNLEEYTSKIYSEENSRIKLENSDSIYHLIYYNTLHVG